jgi:CHAT domain-containing protein
MLQLLKEDLKFALPDENTVVLHFVAAKDEMFIVSMRKKSGTEDVVGEINRLTVPIKQIADACSKLEMEVLTGTDSFSRDLYWMLSIEELLNATVPNPKMQECLHIIIIPDGPLIGVPLHAIADDRGKCLIERVASIRYAASLSSLIWQARHEDIKTKVPQHNKWSAAFFGNSGTEFLCATPGSDLFCGPKRVDEISEVLSVQCHKAMATIWEELAQGRISTISGTSLQVERELGFVLTNTPSVEWNVFSENANEDKVCSRANFAMHHRWVDILWLATHGGLAIDCLPDGQEVESFSALMCDGVVSCERMLAENYDFSTLALFHSSCCWLGKGGVSGYKEVDGFVATLTSSGCRRISAALWELDDRAAFFFAKHFSKALSEHVFDARNVQPHAFAMAFKQALINLREEDGMSGVSKWAPFVLFGLG